MGVAAFKVTGLPLPWLLGPLFGCLTAALLGVRMQVLILGLGNVGKALAIALREAGHRVVGTTTTPAKVDDLSALADEVHVLTGDDVAAVRSAAAGCSAGA